MRSSIQATSVMPAAARTSFSGVEAVAVEVADDAALAHDDDAVGHAEDLGQSRRRP